MEDKGVRQSYKVLVQEIVEKQVSQLMDKLQEIMRYHPSEDLQDANFKLASFLDNDAKSFE